MEAISQSVSNCFQSELADLLTQTIDKTLSQQVTRQYSNLTKDYIERRANRARRYKKQIGEYEDVISKGFGL